MQVVVQANKTGGQIVWEVALWSCRKSGAMASNANELANIPKEGCKIGEGVGI